MNVMLERVHGPVLRPGDAGFDEECTGYQLAHPHRPDVVVGATSAEDVRAAVAHAAERGLPLAVQATGHGRGVPLDGGLLIGTRRMTGVRVDPAARSARIEAGVHWGRVVEAAAVHGLAPLSGSAPGVGAVGYTLGGGLGVLGRAYGWAADHVRSVELVTPDARLRRTSPDAEPDLFTALRSGAGVVTAMEIGLVPVTRLYGGSLLVDGEHVPALLDAYRSWTASLPDALSSSVALIPFGGWAARVRIAFDGPAADGERLVAPLRNAVPLLEDTLREMPFTAAHTIFDDPTQPHPYTGTNALLGGLDPAVLRSVVELAGPDAPVPTVVQVRHLGGALSRPGPAELGAHRRAAHVVSVLSLVEGRDAEGPAHRKLLDAVAPWTLGRGPNFEFGPQER